jgi:hypothetical protein
MKYTEINAKTIEEQVDGQIRAGFTLTNIYQDIKALDFFMSIMYLPFSIPVM